MKTKTYLVAGALVVGLTVVTMSSGVLSAAPSGPTSTPGPVPKCQFTPPEMLPATAPAAATATADPGTNIADCLRLDRYIPQSRDFYGPGSDAWRQFKAGARAADGSVALFCPDDVHGGVQAVPANTRICPVAPKPPRTTSYIPGAPHDGADGVVFCDKPATKQIQVICATGKDPGFAVNGASK